MDLSNLDSPFAARTRTKPVVLFGKTLNVHYYTKYITVNVDGEVIAWICYSPMPSPEYSHISWVSHCMEVEILGRLDMRPEYDASKMIMEV